MWVTADGERQYKRRRRERKQLPPSYLPYGRIKTLEERNRVGDTQGNTLQQHNENDYNCLWKQFQNTLNNIILTGISRVCYN